VRCQEAQELLHGYLDGELDLVRSVEIGHHIQQCQICAPAYKQQQALRSAIRGGSLYYSPPTHLQKRVQSAVRQASKADTPPRVRSWRWLSLGAALAAVALMFWGLVPILTRPAVDDHLAQELIAGHVRSLMASHLTDVTSSDQHTVKPWFEGKLDFSPPVSDLTDQGFPLLGGRLDYLDNRPVAALVYKRQRHFINLFIWPAESDVKVEETMLMRQGYYLVRWRAAGMTYWVVSDLNRSELQAFVRTVRHRVSPTAP
jgi:anti-sigma factor RsiW